MARHGKISMKNEVRKIIRYKSHTLVLVGGGLAVDDACRLNGGASCASKYRHDALHGHPHCWTGASGVQEQEIAGHARKGQAPSGGLCVR